MDETKEYVATFHTHLSALMTSRNLEAMGVEARMAPTPRRLSASCGTCVRYRSAGPALKAMDRDVEGVYEVADSGYRELLRNE